MLRMFDEQIMLWIGQANVRYWTDDILPLLTGHDDPLGVDAFATHHVPLTEPREAYDAFQKTEDETLKVVFRP